MSKFSNWWHFREGKETTIVVVMVIVLASIAAYFIGQPDEPKDPDICTSFCIRDINDVPRYPQFFKENPDLLPEHLKEELRG